MSGGCRVGVGWVSVFLENKANSDLQLSFSLVLGLSLAIVLKNMFLRFVTKTNPLKRKFKWMLFDAVKCILKVTMAMKTGGGYST